MSEPVAYIRTRDGLLAKNDGGTFGPLWAPLYAASPQRPLLSKDEVMLLFNETAGFSTGDEAHIQRFARAIERKVRGEE